MTLPRGGGGGKKSGARGKKERLVERWTEREDGGSPALLRRVMPCCVAFPLCGHQPISPFCGFTSPGADHPQHLPSPPYCSFSPQFSSLFACSHLRIFASLHPQSWCRMGIPLGLWCDKAGGFVVCKGLIQVGGFGGWGIRWDLRRW